MQHTWTIRDEHGVVHELPENWAVRSWKTVCGDLPPNHQPQNEAVTCLRCLVTPRRVGGTRTGSSMLWSSGAGRASSLRAASDSSERVQTVTMDSSTPMRPRRV